MLRLNSCAFLWPKASATTSTNQTDVRFRFKPWVQNHHQITDKDISLLSHPCAAADKWDKRAGIGFLFIPLFGISPAAVQVR